MPTTSTPTKASVLMLNAVNVPANTPVRSAKQKVNMGARVRGRITNGSTGPTMAGYIDVYAAAMPDGGDPPDPAASGAIGADWFFIGRAFGAGLVASTIYDLLPVYVGPEFQWVVLEAAGNLSQAVTATGRLDRIDNVVGT